MVNLLDLRLTISKGEEGRASHSLISYILPSLSLPFCDCESFISFLRYRFMSLSYHVLWWCCDSGSDDVVVVVDGGNGGGENDVGGFNHCYIYVLCIIFVEQMYYLSNN